MTSCKNYQYTRPVTTPSVATASAATSTVTSTAPTPAPLNLPFDSLRASIDRALIASKPADYERALALIDGALAQRPDDAVLLHYRGFLLYREGSYLVTTGRDATRAKSRFEEAERVLGLVDITVNKNMVPFDTQSPFVTSGIRIGSPAITTRGLKEAECAQVVQLIDAAITHRDNDAELDRIRFQVDGLMRLRPLFAH